jgi:hypothetical protein
MRPLGAIEAAGARAGPGATHSNPSDAHRICNGHGHLEIGYKQFHHEFWKMG